jgi:Na+-driven multidrug efflux pump
MSEIKGQLLGIILVIMVFAAVGTVMVSAFRGFGSTVSTQISEAISEVSEA